LIQDLFLLGMMRPNLEFSFIGVFFLSHHLEVNGSGLIGKVDPHYVP
jgi:hypothetical protein